MAMNIAALIPVKGFRNAKQRLSPLLSRVGRELLAEAMFRDVLRQLARVSALAATYVVTGDDKVAGIAADSGAEVIREKDENGETSAVDFARIKLKETGYDSILILPSDIPLVRTADVEMILRQMPADAVPPFALLVPSHDRLGTNALLLAPPDLIELRFGYDSFTFHMSQLITQGLPARFFENEHIALDIDEPKDLERFVSYGIEDGDTMETARRFLAVPQAWQTRHSGSA
jgi:2-phospho-L-lactate/phosphoenolpyruvate guanylyltransferase